jgi:hypothetical protein
MVNSSEVISEFRWDLPVPDKDFKKSILKSTKIVLIHEHKDVTYSQERISSRYISDHYNFKVIIPNYLYDFLVNNHPEYDSEVDNGTDYIKNSKKFTKTHRAKSFDDLHFFFLQMTQDALFMKTLEDYSKFNKVIFLSNSFCNNKTFDDYNHAYTGNRIGLGFRYFVAFEVPKNDFLLGKGILTYYGLWRSKSSFGAGKKNDLPLLPSGSIEQYTKIKWTQERENFLALIEKKIASISESINGFVAKLKEDNFDLLMNEMKNKQIEFHPRKKNE